MDDLIKSAVWVVSSDHYSPGMNSVATLVEVATSKKYVSPVDLLLWLESHRVSLAERNLSGVLSNRGAGWTS